MKSKADSMILALAVVAVIFISGCVEQQQIAPPSEKIVFAPPPKLKDAIEGKPYEYSFCEPSSARSGATCGGLAGVTTNPYGGNPPYSFSHQFGVGFIPPGLALELNGLLRGTPTLPGNYTFGICVTDLYKEVCKTTSLTVKPKSEQVEEEVSVEEEREEVVTRSVKIKSATAKVKEAHKIAKDYTWCICTVEMSGTATLAVNDALSLWVQAPQELKAYSCSPGWDDMGDGNCWRSRPEQPATGEWSIKYEQTFDVTGLHSRCNTVAVRYGARIGADGSWSWGYLSDVWDQACVECCP